MVDNKFEGSFATTKTLVVLLGPTGVGKTSISLRLAKNINAEIFSSDSRQFYRELKIGTAAPTENQLTQVKHHFIASHSLTDNYNAGQYEQDVLNCLNQYFESKSVALLVGGSMMYIDAVCNGLDNIPSVDQSVRKFWKDEFNLKGLDYICHELEKKDPQYFLQVDKQNHKRILHALEVCDSTGLAFSSFHTGKKKFRPFNIIKIGLNRPRPELYQRINERVDEMMALGLLDEAKEFYNYRHLNAMNTVGYKELYEYMSEGISLLQAVEKIKKNTRNYAKRQLTWFNRDTEIHWFHPQQEVEIERFVNAQLLKEGI